MNMRIDMNGICAIINKNYEVSLYKKIISSMIKAIAGDNPDKVFVGTYKNIGVGIYNRYSENSENSFYEDNEVLIACDAEIYNHNTIVNELAVANSDSEAELIAYLYRRSGDSWYGSVDGVFSVFIWDKKLQKGMAFTDRIGIKPLVYFENSDYIIITSHLKSIRALPQFSPHLENQAIYSYLAMEMIPTPYTIYKDVFKLEGGHYLKITDGKLNVIPYWKMTYPEDKITDEKKLTEDIYELVKNSVKQHLNYQGSVDKAGAFLSGGTDSSTIVGLINELHPGKARSFSIGFDEVGYDEMGYARTAAEAFNSEHNEYYITEDDIVKFLPTVVDYFDEPFANSSVIPAYFCAKMARDKGVEVLLAGDGGDEIFGGNERYISYLKASKKYPQTIVNIMGSLVKLIPDWLKISLIRDICRYFSIAAGGVEHKISAYNIYDYLKLNQIYNTEFLKAQVYKSPLEISHYYIEQAGTDNELDKFLYNDLKLTLMDNDLRKVNNMVEMAGIRVRYPFLSHSIFEYSGRIPPELKVKGDCLRYIFKETFKELLPQKIIKKQKHGFGLPVVPWLLRPGHLHDFVYDIMLDQKTKNRGIFHRDFVSKLLKSSERDRTTFYGTYIYFILFMELWLRRHYDQ